MKVYHVFFFLLQLVILGAIALIYIKKFPTKNNVYIIIDSLFKFSLGLFIVTYFLTNKEHKIQMYDRILIILFGLTLLVLIDYIALMNIVFQMNLSDPYSIQQTNK